MLRCPSGKNLRSRKARRAVDADLTWCAIGCRSRASAGPLIAAFDELFGHWWYEGCNSCSGYCGLTAAGVRVGT